MSTGNGNWNQAATWSCPGTPLPGDTVIIQAGHIVYQTNNQTYSGTPMVVHVYGQWQFSGGGSKISLPCGSIVEIHAGGALHPDPAYQGFSETVRICNITYWNTTMGSQNGPVIWPPPLAPLPVELVNFQALNEDMEIILRWTTASERDVSHFMVHRSNEQLTRQVVGSHAAVGHSLSLQQYSLRDAPDHAGLYYYHLEEVGIDGKSKELAVAMTRYEKRVQLLRCAPNPLARSEMLTVDIPMRTNGIDVRLVGNEGRWMRPSSLDLDGSLIVIMDGLHLSAGIYTLQVLEGGSVLGTCRFMLE